MGTWKSPDVFVVDDDHDSRELICEFLQWKNLSVRCSEGGLAAIAQARIEKPRLVLLDLWMRPINGWDFERMLKRDLRTATTPIIIVSGAVMDDESDRALKLGCQGFLSKPISLRNLSDAVDAALNRPQSTLPAVGSIDWWRRDG